MRRFHPGSWLLLTIALLTLASPAAAQSNRPTVALLDFDFASIQHWWSGNQDIGKGIADMIVDGLVEDGTYRVIERKRISDVLAEQDFSNSDRADPSQGQVVKIGKALGVKYLIVGSVTKFGMEDKNTRFGGSVLGRRNFGVGDVGTKKGKASVAVTARMIDTTTGEIMRLTQDQGDNEEPTWAPDGRYLAFQSTRDGRQPRLYMATADGRWQTRISDLAGTKTPVWAP